MSEISFNANQVKSDAQVSIIKNEVLVGLGLDPESPNDTPVDMTIGDIENIMKATAKAINAQSDIANGGRRT